MSASGACGATAFPYGGPVRTPTAGHDPASSPADLQRRVVRTLVVSQVLGGIGVSGGIAVGSLLAESILGSSALAGLANTFQILGSAVLVLPMVRVMAQRGRRVGLCLGYVVAVVGAVLAVTSAVVRSFELLLLGAFLFGAATATNNQARYAAVDLAQPHHRGRDLSLVVWATTVGAVLGPNMLTPSAGPARAVGLDPIAGVWVVSIVAFASAAVWLSVRLRPDPLLTARAEADPPAAGSGSAAGHASSAGAGVHRPSLADAWRAIRARPAAVVGIATVSLGHTVMVSVMVMTPLHLHHGGAGLQLVGIVISIHVLGMYAFSPIMGRLVDTRGARFTACLGGLIQVVGCAFSGLADPGWSWGLTVGLFLIGLGWSATLVSGSTLVTSAVPIADRPGAQGLTDLFMGLCGAVGGGLSGFVVQWWGYPLLSVLGAALAASLTLIATRPFALTDERS